MRPDALLDDVTLPETRIEPAARIATRPRERAPRQDELLARIVAASDVREVLDLRVEGGGE